MHLDISRDSFHPAAHFLRVLQHQGGVLVDADSNEQAAILLDRLQKLAVHLLGSYWGPPGSSAFQIALTSGKNDLTIGTGSYYVNGCLIEYDPAKPTYLGQANLPISANDLAHFPLGVYLDVWERHLTELEANFKDPGLEQLASSTRTQVISQIRVVQLQGDKLSALPSALNAYLTGPSTASGAQAQGKLSAGPVSIPPATPTPGKAQCPDSTADRYTGMENQLYRVEVHQSGPACAAGTDWTKVTGYATFKWSRDNGSMIYPIKDLSWSEPTLTVTLKTPGPDDYSRLKVNDWVEYLDESVALTVGFHALDPLPAQAAPPLFQVKAVDPLDPSDVTLTSLTAGTVGVPTAPGANAFLRRWDQQPAADSPAVVPAKGPPAPNQSDNGLLVVAGGGDAGWFTLENGVQVSFAPGTYRRGDYWLIPARIATGAVLWPADQNQKPIALPPHGVRHWYAPLQVFLTPTSYLDCRRILDPTKLLSLFIIPAPVGA